MITLALIDQVGGWWTELGLAKQIFYGIGLCAGLVSLVLALLSFIGIEHHDAVDAIGTADLGHGGGGIFSVKPLTGFFLGFGWAGGMTLDYGASLPVAILIALVAGGVIMAVIVVMFRLIISMRSDGTMRIADAAGAIGTVYITLPPDKAAGGQVTVSFKGRQETFAALNQTARPLASGEKIRVVSVIDARTVLVEPL